MTNKNAALENKWQRELTSAEAALKVARTHGQAVAAMNRITTAKQALNRIAVLNTL